LAVILHKYNKTILF